MKILMKKANSVSSARMTEASEAGGIMMEDEEPEAEE